MSDERAAGLSASEAATIRDQLRRPGPWGVEQLFDLLRRALDTVVAQSQRLAELVAENADLSETLQLAQGNESYDFGHEMGQRAMQKHLDALEQRAATLAGLSAAEIAAARRILGGSGTDDDWALYVAAAKRFGGYERALMAEIEALEQRAARAEAALKAILDANQRPIGEGQTWIGGLLDAVDQAHAALAASEPAEEGT